MILRISILVRSSRKKTLKQRSVRDLGAEREGKGVEYVYER